MRRLAILLAACALSAGEAFTPPVLSITAPDLARSGARLSAGPYGAIWRLPELQRLRDDLARLPGADPAWLALAERAQEARAELRLPLHGSGAKPDARLALRLPQGQEPAAPAWAQALRQGGWWILGTPDVALEVPAATAGPAEADLRLRLDLGAIAASLPQEGAGPYAAVLGVLGLSGIEAEAIAVADGVVERIRAPGAALPLRPVDPAALAGLPESPLGLCAVGVDGRALVRTVRAISAAVDGEARLAAGDAALRGWIGIGLDELLLACDGTAVCATTPSAPFPAMTLSLPASPQGDALVAGLLGLAKLDGRALLAEARTRTVPMSLPRLPLPLLLRRTATRLIVGSDAAVVDRLAHPAPAPFPIADLWPEADGAVALSWGDSRAQAQLLIGYLPMALMQVRDEDVRRRLGQAQQVLVAALPHLRPATLAARADAAGLRIDGREALVTDIMPLSIGAGMLVPAIQLVRQSARRTQAGNNMRLICLAMIAYGADHDGRWPIDLAEVRAWSEGDLVETLFQSPGSPEIAEPFLYVRPEVAAQADQPVIVQDPACNRGRGSMVVYADGHVAFVPGAALWAEARRLAALPKAQVREQGIAMADWAVDTVTGQPAGAVPPADPQALF